MDYIEINVFIHFKAPNLFII